MFLYNARLLDPANDIDRDGSLLLEKGRIKTIDPVEKDIPENVERIDCKGNILTPGLIDTCAFTGEPGSEYRETLASASNAAAALSTVVVSISGSPSSRTRIGIVGASRPMRPAMPAATNRSTRRFPRARPPGGRVAICAICWPPTNPPRPGSSRCTTWPGCCASWIKCAPRCAAAPSTSCAPS